VCAVKYLNDMPCCCFSFIVVVFRLATTTYFLRNRTKNVTTRGGWKRPRGVLWGIVGYYIGRKRDGWYCVQALGSWSYCWFSFRLPLYLSSTHFCFATNAPEKLVLVIENIVGFLGSFVTLRTWVPFEDNK